MEVISLDFHCFKALNNYLEARLFLHVQFYASSDLLMACRTMQLRFFKLGTVLTYAFNSYKAASTFDRCHISVSQICIQIAPWLTSVM